MIINGKEIRINRENAVISEADEAYFQLVKQILEEGMLTHNRTGIDTLSIAGWNYKFDLQKAFPILETKFVNIKNAISEIQWIHQEQSNEVKWLHERENHIWDLWVVDDDGIYRTYEQGDNAVYDPERIVPLKRLVRNEKTGLIERELVLDNSGKPIMVKSKDMMDNIENPRTIKEAIWYGPEYAGTIGEAYGFINRTYKRPQYVENTLKTNPFDRRMNINLWQDAHLLKAVLPSCVWSIEFKVTPDGKLHCYVHQRSADTGAGLPFNIPQYAVIFLMFAKAAGLEPGTMSWSIMDAHIYVNQLDAIKKQLKRYEYMKEYSNFIQKSPDSEIEEYYHKMSESYRSLNIRAKILIEDYNDEMKTSEIIKKLKAKDKKIGNEYEEIYERKICFEHLLTRETPILDLEDHDSIFDYSTDYAKKGDSYLQENPIGNKEIVLKNYHHTPFIGMPVAQ